MDALTNTQPTGHNERFRVGTSGWSFGDWVGTFYPAETTKAKMFDRYVEHFPTVEVNYTYYRMPTQRTMASIARRSGPDFDAWVKANQDITHKRQREPVRAFLDALLPLAESGKLAGVLLQFPQSFHRTAENRRFLADVLGDFAAQSDQLGYRRPLWAVEFRHASWDHPSVADGLRDRQVVLAWPDVPQIPALYRPRPAITGPAGYIRLHSRNADKWYAGAVERYDYNYSADELKELYDEWSELAKDVNRVYTFFNNCHRGQAAENAEAFERLMDEIE